MFYIIMSVTVAMRMLGLIKPDEKPHEATRKDDGFGFSHMDFFFDNDQGITQNKYDQRKVPHPCGGQCWHAWPLNVGSEVGVWA